MNKIKKALYLVTLNWMVKIIYKSMVKSIGGKTLIAVENKLPVPYNDGYWKTHAWFCVPTKDPTYLIFKK